MGFIHGWFINDTPHTQIWRPWKYVQLLNFAYKRLLNKAYENEVTLIRHTLKNGLDLLILKILDLWSKGCKETSFQSLSSKEKVCHFGHSSRHVCKRIWPWFEPAQGRITLKVWQPATFRPFNIQTPNFQHLKI